MVKKKQKQTNPQTNKHTDGPITIHCTAKLSMQCNEDDDDGDDNRLNSVQRLPISDSKQTGSQSTWKISDGIISVG